MVVSDSRINGSWSSVLIHGPVNLFIFDFKKYPYVCLLLIGYRSTSRFYFTNKFETRSEI